MKHLFIKIILMMILTVFVFLLLNSCGGGGIVIKITGIIRPKDGEEVLLPITFEWLLNMNENVEGTLTIYTLGGMPSLGQEFPQVAQYEWDSNNYDPESESFKLVVESGDWIAPGTYGWIISAVDRNQNFAESEMATFVIASPVCYPQIAPLNPEDLDEEVELDDYMIWIATPCLNGTLTYDLHATCTNPDEPDQFLTIPNLHTNQYMVGNFDLARGAIVEWNVTVYEEGAGSRTSSVRIFMVKPEDEEISNPPEYSSADLACAKDSEITAEELLYLLKKYIKKYKRIKIFVDSCNSGGIRKVIEDSGLKDVIVKTSSRWCEKSWTYTRSGKKYSLWMDKLLEALKKANWTLKRADDRAYKSVTKHRSNQHPTAHIPNDLSKERLRNKEAQSHHVLLVSGNCKNIEKACENDLENWWETLKKRGFSPSEISSITNAASSDIINKLKNLSNQMNENEEFIFIFTGHGSKGQRITKSSTSSGKDIKNLNFFLDPLVAEAMDSAISSPTLTLSATTTEDCEVTMTVFLNEFELGSFRVITDEEDYPYRRFKFSKNLLMLEDPNILTLQTQGSDTCVVHISDVVLGSGAVPKEEE